MVHEGAPEPLLRTPSSRTGSGGSQSFVDLLLVPHLKFRYKVRHYVPTNREEAHLRMVQQRMQYSNIPIIPI
jgi:hypothetical protein